MKRVYFTALLLAAPLLAFQSVPGEIRLVIKGDDMGAAHGINTATIDAFRRGVLTATNIIVPSPWFPEAARLVNENPGLDVGVHLAITSEWDNIKWRPLTSAPSIVDADGYFYPTVRPRDGSASHTSIAEAAWSLSEIERELRAQLTLAKRHIPQISYTWNHMGFDSLAPEVHAMVSRLSHEFGLIVPQETGIRSIGKVYESQDTGAIKAAKLAARLEKLEPGLWLHIDHASTEDAEMRAIGHKGYDGVAADRSANHDAWISPQVREVIVRRNIRLTNYRELARELNKP